MVRYDQGASNNNQQGNPKLDYDEYIETSFEPFDSRITSDVSAAIEMEMAENIYDMRREFKRQNKRLRKLYASKEPNRHEHKRSKTSRFQRASNRRAVA